MVMAVGVPRCSWRRMMSERAEAFAEESRLGRIRLPRFRRIDVGRRSLISLLKIARRVEGLREVVTRGLGSVRPERRLYSSSMLCWASAASWSSDSSYL
jgi:hypothetical protein